MTVEADGIRATVYVEASPAEAFTVFTRDIDRWWQRGPRFRFGRGRAQDGTMRLDGRALVEELADGTSFEIGQVSVWEPGVRLVVGWRLTNFAPDETTEVEVTFSPSGEGTEVVLVHRGWAAIRGDHPARHGQAAPAFLRELGMWWASLTRGFRRWFEA
jgi:uncharacterized protein YndB with AHSA1/START domain